MGQSHQPHLQLLYNEVRLDILLQALDELHTAASDGHLTEVTTLSNAEIIGWLNDLAYTAQETIAEIRKGEGAYPAGTPHLRLVK
jgi:hypothetical protein